MAPTMIYQLTLTGLVLGSTATVTEAGTDNVLGQVTNHGSTTWAFSYSDGGFEVDIRVVALGMAPWSARVTLPAANSSLPIDQAVDRSLLIPVSNQAAARAAIGALGASQIVQGTGVTITVSGTGAGLTLTFSVTGGGGGAWGSITGSLNAQTDLQGALDAKQATASRGQPNGYASLDSSGQIPAAQIPAIAITEFLGVAASQSAMLALAGQRGDWCARSDTGTTWVITGADPTVIGGWTQLSYPGAPVASVAGRTGAVTLTSADLGDRTSVGAAVFAAANEAAARTALALGTAATTDSSAYATAAQGTDDRTASSIRTATTVVAFGAAAAPSAGQVLTALSSTSASWQTPSGGGPSLGGSPTGALLFYDGAAIAAVTGAVFENTLTRLAITRANAGTANTPPTSGLSLENTTAATSTQNQFSPALRFVGQGWKTNATAGSQETVVNVWLQQRTRGPNPVPQLIFAPTIAGTAVNGIGFVSSIAGGAATFGGTYITGLDGSGAYGPDSGAGWVGIGPSGGNNAFAAYTNGTSVFAFVQGAAGVTSGAFLGWASATANSSGSFDVQLHRVAADTLRLRRGTNAQVLQVSNTWTDASNGEWFNVGWSSNVCTIETQANGTGTVRPLRLRLNGVAFSTLPTPAAGNAGLRVSITDCSVDPVGNYWAVASGGGAFFANLTSDGANWRIGG